MALEHAVEQPLDRLLVADVHRLRLGRAGERLGRRRPSPPAARAGARSRPPWRRAGRARAPPRGRGRCRRRRPRRRCPRAGRAQRFASPRRPWRPQAIWLQLLGAMKVRVDTRPLDRPASRGAARGPRWRSSRSSPGRWPARAPSWRAPAASRPCGCSGSGRAVEWLKIPIPAFVIHHPGAGPFLVDTGLHASVASSPTENLGRIIGGGRAGAGIEPGEDLPAQLRARGIDPKAVRLVVMTHMHFDHTSGMSQFPGATFVVTEEEWEAATTDSRPAAARLPARRTSTTRSTTGRSATTRSRSAPTPPSGGPSTCSATAASASPRPPATAPATNR